MRPRFSLRLILGAIGIFAVLLYVCVVRPTMLANRFVAAVNAQNVDTVDSYLGNRDWREEANTGLTRGPATRTDHIYADLFPRDWGDWLLCRRRIVLRIARHWDDHGHRAEWTEDIDLGVRATGITIWPPEREF
jgi:hypothetical protein